MHTYNLIPDLIIISTVVVADYGHGKVVVENLGILGSEIEAGFVVAEGARYGYA